MPPQLRAIIVRRYCWPTDGDIRWARSATKHRISRERSRYVIEHCRRWIEEDPPVGAPAGTDLRFVGLGEDADGIALEVIVIKLSESELLVIHAMPLRDRYREEYRKAMEWQK